MRILIITQRWYPDTFGGSEHVAAEQARQLAARGHQVTVITERVRDILPPEIVEKPPLNPLFEKEGKREVGELRIYRYGSEREFNRFGGASRTDLKEVPRIVRKLTPPISPPSEGEKRRGWDVALLHHPFPAAGFFRAGLRIPTLYIFHSSTAREIEYEGVKKFPISNFQFPITARWLGRRFAKWVLKVERLALLQCDQIAVLSEFSKGVLLGIAPQTRDQVVRLGVGIEQEQFRPSDKAQARRALGLEERRNIILTVRRFSPRMGLSKLIYAMEAVLDKIPNTQLLIVGEGPLRPSLQKEIELRGLQGKVTLVGTVPLDDLPLYYQAADVFVLPTEAFEGLGMATLEALASGVPVVGTPAGATPEILNDLDSQLLTQGTKADDLADGLLRFFARSQRDRNLLGSKTRALVEKKYNWHRAVGELESLLEGLRIKQDKD